MPVDKPSTSALGILASVDVFFSSCVCVDGAEEKLQTRCARCFLAEPCLKVRVVRLTLSCAMVLTFRARVFICFILIPGGSSAVRFSH